MKTIINSLIEISKSILAAPIQVPEKLKRINKYIHFGLQVLKQIMEMQEKENEGKQKKKSRYVFR